MCKKFIKYRVEVVYRNGQVENFNLKGYNEYSYKSMLQLYNFVKKKFSNEECNIRFTGITFEGEQKIMFLKENKTKKPEFQIQAEKYTNVTMVELMERLQETIELIDKRNKWLEDEIKVMDKLENIELHNMEVDSAKLNVAKKIEIFDNIQNLRSKRRFYKEEQKSSNECLKLIKSFNNIKLKTIINDRRSVEKIDYKLLDERLLKDKKIFTKSYYKDENDREILKKSLSKKYDVVIVRDNLRAIIAYNKARC